MSRPNRNNSRGPERFERWSVTALLFVLGIVSPVTAEVYQWVDDKGSVHFSDAPPPAGRKYEVRTFPDTPRTTPRAVTTNAPAAATPEHTQPAPKPAHLVLRDRVNVDLGNGGRVFSGRVENEGEETAYDVAVAITVTETDSGRPCLQDEMQVDPLALAPNEAGAYNKVFHSGCFQRAHRTELRVLWR